MGKIDIASAKEEVDFALDVARKRKKTLLGYINQIESSLNKGNFNDYAKALYGEGTQDRQLFRKIHDYFGWKAKDSRSVRGGCSGSLYRSTSFLLIPKELRVGSRKTQNIHIEHVIPINLIPKLIWSNRHNLNNSEDIFNSLMKYSICAGLAISDKAQVDRSRKIEGKLMNWRNNHPSILVEGENAYIVDDRPFARYIGSGIEVFSIIDEENINFERFTFSDHMRMVASYASLNWCSYKVDQT